MNVLVVGGAGYIGSHVVRALLDKKYGVTVFDNLSSGSRENLFAEAQFIQGDILDRAALSEAMQDGAFGGLIHLAAFKAAGESMLKPEKYSVNNICGTINILNAAAECGINRIVFSSSAAVYGEPRYVPLDEEHPLSPENYYGFTKLEIERFLGWYDKLKGMRFAALRYFNAAGYDTAGRVRGLERNPANLLPIVMEVAAGMRAKLSIYGSDYATDDGTCIRDYVHVNDLADAHVSALEYIQREQRSLTVNLGSEQGVSVQAMVVLARKITGRAIPAEVVGRRPGDPAKLVASSKKAADLLGWKARVSDVETLIGSTWNIYKTL
ncbi:MAG: UDP-glucose 4-epimerase GalE [Chitinivibrionales bacterium]|nr:UDP-glucose 4-epimerase GalE [Chitinivibrionales bacterium]